MTSSDDPTGELMAARQRHHAAIALAAERAPQAPELPGFVWAHRALRLVAFGAPDCECPDGMDPVAALAAIGAASIRLRGALAGAHGVFATGHSVRFAGEALPSPSRNDMEARIFANPYLELDLHACLALDYSAAPLAMIDTWRKAGSPGWCEVLLREKFVLALTEPMELDAPHAKPSPELSSQKKQALAWMEKAQREAVTQRGGLIAARPLGQMMKDKVGFPARWVDSLYQYLPEGLRNPPRR